MAETGQNTPWTTTLPAQHLYKTWVWEPKPDITVYELAVAIPLLTTRAWNVGQAIEAAAPEVRRHFREQ